MSEWYFVERFILAFISGALMSMSGSFIQTVSENEMASPSTLGFDGLYVFFILLSYSLNIIYQTSLSIELLSTAIVIIVGVFFYSFLPNVKRTPYRASLKTPTQKLVLIGLCFNLFIGALFSVMQFFFFAFNYQFPSQLWFGNFRFLSHGVDWILFTGFIMLWPMGIFLAKKLRFLPFGRDFCLAQGVYTLPFERLAIVLSFIATGIVTTQFGVFSFFGLVAPLILRQFSFFQTRLLNEIIWGPLLLGFSLALLDYLCFSFPIYGSELPVGMLSALLGSFVFILLIIRQFKST